MEKLLLASMAFLLMVIMGFKAPEPQLSPAEN